MKKGGLLSILFFFLAFLSGEYLFAKDKDKIEVAFVEFKNSQNIPDVDFLANSLPLSISSTLSKDDKYTVYQPKEFGKAVKDKSVKPADLLKAIDENNIAKLRKSVSADAVIYGDYLYDPADDSLRVNVKMYLVSQQSEIVFTVDGYLGFGIFNIIDKVKIILTTYLTENKYITKAIPKGSNIALISNLTNREKNQLLISFLREGYNVKAFMLNDFHYLERGETIPFYNLTSREMSLSTMPREDEKQFQALYGVQMGSAVENVEARIKNDATIKKYTQEYRPLKLAAVKKIKENYYVDYLIVIHFDHRNKKMYTRAIDLKDENIIWIQNSISVAQLSDSEVSYQKIAGIIIKEMSQVQEIRLDFTDDEKKEEGKSKPQEKM